MKVKNNTNLTDDQSSSMETAAKRRRMNIRKKEYLPTTKETVNANNSINLSQKMCAISIDKDSLVSGNIHPITNKIGSSHNISYNYIDSSKLPFLEHKIKSENVMTQKSNMVYENILNSKKNVSKSKHLPLYTSIETTNKKQNHNLIDNTNNYDSVVNGSSSKSSILSRHECYSYEYSDASKDGTFSNNLQEHNFFLESGVENISDSDDSNPLILNFSDDDDDSGSICEEDKDKLQDLLEETLYSRQKAFFRSPKVIEVLQNLAGDLLESP